VCVCEWEREIEEPHTGRLVPLGLSSHEKTKYFPARYVFLHVQIFLYWISVHFLVFRHLNDMFGTLRIATQRTTPFTQLAIQHYSRHVSCCVPLRCVDSADWIIRVASFRPDNTFIANNTEVWFWVLGYTQAVNIKARAAPTVPAFKQNRTAGSSVTSGYSFVTPSLILQGKKCLFHKFLSSFQPSWQWRQQITLKRRNLSNTLHGVTFLRALTLRII
jgi:hypothetical protein